MTVKMYVDLEVERLIPLYSKDEAKALVTIVLEDLCNIPAHCYYSDPDRLLPVEQLPYVQRASLDLQRGRPIQYILGKAFFDGLEIQVREGVLIPRPETQELVRWAKQLLLDGNQIMDLCTGSGAIAIALSKVFPQSKVYGVDLYKDALDVGIENNRLNHTDVHFIQADILQDPNLYRSALLPHSFDLIISNPPYVRMGEKGQMRTNVLEWEPHHALFVPDDDPLLFYRALGRWGKAFLKEGGRVMAEINKEMGDEVTALLVGHGYKSVQVVKDLNGNERMVSAFL
ncbi:MAG: peptide chain release factor N(5)-glutamine methyltransferase [Prevotellaceae bacterium]|jgi:release factor glutamine methyltransferase|nr:peptide chain release factor N(5)-glutamine methyltransferase [Prevotellaceae bacterium]